MQQIHINNRPNPPLINIFTTAANADDFTDTRVVSVGDDEPYELPLWAVSEARITTRCGQCPTLDSAPPPCGVETRLISDNPPAGSPPLVNHPAHPPGTALHTPHSTDSGSAYFLPDVLTFMADDYCRTAIDLGEFTVDMIEAYAHRAAARMLVEGGRGNPSLALYATPVTPTTGGVFSSVDAVVALKSLHRNFDRDGVVVVPWQAIGELIENRLITARYDPEGRPVGYWDAWGYPVVTDTGLTGLVGPPASPWDQTTPIDPTTALTVVDTTQEDAGWMYIASGVAAGVTRPRFSLSRKTTPGSGPERGNFRHAVAQADVIAWFDPCDVLAAKVGLNRTIGCA